MGKNGVPERSAEQCKHSRSPENGATHWGDPSHFTVPGSWAGLWENIDLGTRARVDWNAERFELHFATRSMLFENDPSHCLALIYFDCLIWINIYRTIHAFIQKYSLDNYVQSKYRKMLDCEDIYIFIVTYQLFVPEKCIYFVESLKKPWKIKCYNCPM